LDEHLTYKVLPPLPPLQYNCIFATILPSHQPPPTIGLYANSRCHSIQHLIFQYAAAT
jgi:hypothetical protein